MSHPANKPALALYLGETYASIGFFNTHEKKVTAPLFEKSIFLPQVGLKSLFSQTKNFISENFPDCLSDSNEIPVYIVTKYFDRLKQFRLGGSISQVIQTGFENSYTLCDSRTLSLAASQLIISLDPAPISIDKLKAEYERIKKINPDLNKIVVALPESTFPQATIQEVTDFFTAAGLKIFHCSNPLNQNIYRKTLLNAGSDGTKEEICKELHEQISPSLKIHFFCSDGFETEFENVELFNSADNFFAHYLRKNELSSAAFFDIESFKLLSNSKQKGWMSPWGEIPVDYYAQKNIGKHPFSELKLNKFGLLSHDEISSQLEPGPMIAGRAIKPLLIDLFYAELAQNKFCQSLFPQLSSESLKSKISNLLSVLEKSQKNSGLSVDLTAIRNEIIQGMHDELSCYSKNSESINCIGPLSDLVSNKSRPFSWPTEIMKMRVN